MGLFSLAQAGDEEALNALFRQNVALVKALCARFSYLEDAFQQGCLGLVRAIRGFDEGAGCRFSTYAVPHVLGEIRRAHAPHGNWRFQKAARAVRLKRETLSRALGREPTASELAAAANVPPADLPMYLEGARPPLSLSEWDAALPLPDPRTDARAERFFLRDILERLPARDQRLLYLRYALGRTQKEAAASLCLTQSALSRRERRVCLSVRAEWIGE